MKRFVITFISIIALTSSCSRSAASEMADSTKSETTQTQAASTQDQATTTATIATIVHREDKDVTTSFKLLGLFNLLAILTLFYLVFRRTSSERIKSTAFEAQRFQNKFSEIRNEIPDNLRGKISTMNKEIERLKGEVEELNGVVAELERSGAVSKVRKATSTKVVAEVTPVAPAPYKVLFAKNFRAGVMTVCDEKESQFKLSLSNDDTATFEFCGDVEAAKLNFDGTFDGVCNTEGSSIDSTRVLTIVPGQATRCEEGWKVLTKSTVRFE